MLSDDDLRQMVPKWLASFVAEPWRMTNRERVQALVDDWATEEWTALRRMATGVFREPKVYDSIASSRQLSRTFCRDVLDDPQVDGVEWLEVAMSRGPTIVLCNHLSYIDANAVDALLAWTGAGRFANLLTVAVGPKVFDTPFRRLASSCMNIIPVPQPAGVSNREKLRELAHWAAASMEAAQTAMQRGSLGFVFPEGSRSRSQRLQPFHRGVRRWLRMDDMQVVPVALWGTEQVMPVGRETGLTKHPVRLKIAPPFAVGPDGEPTTVLEKTFSAIAARLPDTMQPTEYRALI